MAEFPAKVSTQTSTSEPSSRAGRICQDLDLIFIRSIPGILMIIEMVLGLLVWALVADSRYGAVPAYGWVMFVAIFCWLMTIILFVTILLQLQRRIAVVPWPIVVLGYHVAATLLYITGFITCAASVQAGFPSPTEYNKRAAASFFAGVVMVAYGGSAFFSFSEWRGVGSNAASA
ncbi:plasmolipin [Pseudophryne corroboree]|uniref:plasmolipin n=1 Tax=Pseudophryne corroboree TaxID=495146 RepID=UPI003081F63D